MHTWHLPRILGQSTCSLFQYPACREHDWKVTWSFERRRRINWFLMIGLWALVASQNSLALEAPSNLVSEWKTEPFSGTWRNYGVLMYSVRAFIVEYLGSYMNVYRCYSEPPLWTHEPTTLFNRATHCSMLEEGKMTSNLMPSPRFDTYHQQGQSRSLVGAIGHRPGRS